MISGWVKLVKSEGFFFFFFVVTYAFKTGDFWLNQNSDKFQLVINTLMNGQSKLVYEINS
jgi:hypothetical protein